MSFGWWRLFRAWTSFTNSSCLVSSGGHTGTTAHNRHTTASNSCFIIHPSIPLFLLRVVGVELIPAGGIYPTCLSQSEPAAAPTLLQGFDSHPPVLRAPQGLPHLSKVALAQFPQEAELLAWPLPRLHVEELPLQTEQRRRERRAAGGPTSLVRKEQRIRLDSCLQHVYFQ